MTSTTQMNIMGASESPCGTPLSIEICGRTSWFTVSYALCRLSNACAVPVPLRKPCWAVLNTVLSQGIFICSPRISTLPSRRRSLSGFGTAICTPSSILVQRSSTSLGT
eukprot:gene8717-7931_t